MRRVVVTGLGAVTPLGSALLLRQKGISRSWDRLIQSKCAINAIKDRPGKWTELPGLIAGLVPSGIASPGIWNPKTMLDSPGDERRLAKFTQYALVAAEEALNDAGWHPNEEQKEMTGVCIGSGIGSLEEMSHTAAAYAQAGYRKISPLFIPQLLVNLAAGHVSIKHGFKGPNHSVSTACTTGAHAIGDASRFIAFGDADVMVAGGSESCVHPLTIAGFARIKGLATAWDDEPRRASRPFDRDRGGFVVGEGAGVVILEELEHAKKRGAYIYAEVMGYGLSADAHHITAPPENGEGAQLAMKRALKHAGIKPKDVDYINAHATSTPQGDIAENRAIKAVMLGEHGVVGAKNINVSSTKGAIGHLLGAAGAVEAIFTILAIHENIMPPTLNLENPGDPPEEFNCNYVPKHSQMKRINVALSNSFGFGGTNACLCFAKPEVRHRGIKMDR